MGRPPELPPHPPKTIRELELTTTKSQWQEPEDDAFTPRYLHNNRDDPFDTLRRLTGRIKARSGGVEVRFRQAKHYGYGYLELEYKLGPDGEPEQKNIQVGGLEYFLDGLAAGVQLVRDAE